MAAKTKKKRNPQDATLRNVRATHTKFAAIERRFENLERYARITRKELREGLNKLDRRRGRSERRMKPATAVSPG